MACAAALFLAGGQQFWHLGPKLSYLIPKLQQVLVFATEPFQFLDRGLIGFIPGWVR